MMRPQTLRIAALLPLCVCLAACETAPRAGSETTAQVLDVPPSRHAVRDGHPELFAALRAGVTRQALEDQRLVQGECGTPDARQPGGTRWTTVTTLLPAGLRLHAGTEVLVGDARGAWPSSTADAPPRLHGRFIAVAADAAPGARAVSCQAPGQPDGPWRVRIRAALPAWSYDFAAPALQRLDGFGDEEFAHGRVVRLGCQLKVVDGGDWYVPVWLARAPAGLALKAGDVVRLRAGAQAGSKDAGPMPEVLTRRDGVPAPGGNAVVRCG